LLHAVSLFAVLYGLWLALSGHYTPFLLVVGAICAALVVAVAMRMDVVDREGHPIHLSYRAPIYWAWLGVQVLISAVRVSRLVLSPRMNLDPALDTVSSSQKTELGKVIYANSITLTPGTLSTAVWPDKIEVHALTREGIDDLKSDDMDRRVTALEGEHQAAPAAEDRS
jgi:multicomponent Na+:H+ antiporter subunit E